MSPKLPRPTMIAKSTLPALCADRHRDRSSQTLDMRRPKREGSAWGNKACEQEISGGKLEATEVHRSGSTSGGTTYKIRMDGSNKACVDMGSEGLGVWEPREKRQRRLCAPRRRESRGASRYRRRKKVALCEGLGKRLTPNRWCRCLVAEIVCSTLWGIFRGKPDVWSGGR